MRKLKQQAEQRSNEILKTSNVKLDRQAGTYQLINKATDKAENLPLSGIDVGSGLFAKNRRVNRLIGKNLTRNAEMNTVGQISPENTPVKPQEKVDTKPATTGSAESTTVAAPSIFGVKFGELPTTNRFEFSSMSRSTLLPRRSTFGNGMHMQFGSGTESTTGPVAAAPPAPNEVFGYKDWLANQRSTIDDNMNNEPITNTKLVPKAGSTTNPRVAAYVNSRFTALPDYIKRSYSGVEAYGKDPMFKNLTESSKEVTDYEQSLTDAAASKVQREKSIRDSSAREQQEKERLKAYFAGGAR